jgi:hypothetical protein
MSLNRSIFLDDEILFWCLYSSLVNAPEYGQDIAYTFTGTKKFILYVYLSCKNTILFMYVLVVGVLS